MTGKSEVAAGAVFARMGAAVHQIDFFTQVHIENFHPVQSHPDARADHDDSQLVPPLNWSMRLNERIFSQRACWIIPQATGTFIGTDREFIVAGEIPDLPLRVRAQIDAIEVGDVLCFKIYGRQAHVLFRVFGGWKNKPGATTAASEQKDSIWGLCFTRG